MKRTKIIATLGPASNRRETIEELIAAGVDVFRLNFSHGDHAGHEKVFRSIRAAARSLGRYTAIMMDLQGPKIRVGDLKDGAVTLSPRKEIKIVTREIVGTSEMISTTYKHLPKDIRKGDVILLDDGNLELRALGVEKGAVRCVVTRGGVLKPHKGINLPGTPVSAPSLTEKDLADLAFGLKLGVDYVAMSFVRRPEDVEAARELIKRFGADVPIVAKIERPEGVKNLRAILKVTDAIMVARGDLGVELPPEKVPELQKMMISLANSAGKGVITATQMLESMVNNARPTRAEASDVANAVFDGTGAVMLSAETASGKYPVETVRMMNRIVKEAERRVLHCALIEPDRLLTKSGGFSGAVSFAAVRAARELGARAIVAFTQSGATARIVSKFRPECTVIGATPHENVARRMNLYWGVAPILFRKVTTAESLVLDVEKRILKARLAKRGDIVVIITGMPVGKAGSTDMMKIHRLGEKE